MTTTTTHRLAALRADAGYSVRGAAREMGLARGTLERAERGESIHPATAKLIADFYGVKVTDIWPVDDREAA